MQLHLVQSFFVIVELSCVAGVKIELRRDATQLDESDQS